MSWEPEDFDENPMVNAVLNVAAQLADNAAATRSLLYAFKFGKTEGMSVAEAIEVGLRDLADAVGSRAASEDE